MAAPKTPAPKTTPLPKTSGEEAVKAPAPIKKKAPAPAPKPKGPSATCPACGDVRDVSPYYDPAVHEQRCPTCRIADREG